MEAIGVFQDVVFTAFLTLIVYFVLPRILSQLGGNDSSTRDAAGIVNKAGFLEHIQREIPEKSLGVSEFRLVSRVDHNDKEIEGNRLNKDEAAGINKVGFVEELFALEEEFNGEKEYVGVGGGDVVEAKERVVLGEIEEEKRSPVAEAQVKFDMGDDLIQEEKLTPVSESQMTLDVRGDAEVREPNDDEVFAGNSGDENSSATEKNKSNDHLLVEEEEGLLGGDWEGIERSELEKRFDTAMAFVESKTNADDRIDGNLRLQFYGLQRVAMEGPCREPQPMALKLSARAKW